MSDGELLEQGHLRSSAAALSRHGAGDAGRNTATAGKDSIRLAGRAPTSGVMANRAMEAGRPDRGGLRSFFSHHSSGHIERSLPASIVNALPLFHLPPPLPPMVMPTKTTSSLHAPASGHTLGAHGGTRCRWDARSTSVGASTCEGSSLPQRRDKVVFEENGACLVSTFSSSRLSAVAAAPPIAARGSNLHGPMGGWWQERGARMWLQMGRTPLSCGRWLWCCLRRKLEGAELERAPGRRRKWRLRLRVFLLSFMVCLTLVLVGLAGSVARLLRQPQVPEWNSTLSVLVQHENAPRRMRLRHSEKVKWIQLPSWTLRVVPASCEDCLDNEMYAIAVQRAVDGLERMYREDKERLLAEWQAPQKPRHNHTADGGAGAAAAVAIDSQDATAALPSTAAYEEFLKAKGGPYAVFANTGAPLGRIGPMLFAMRSVTDDVDVAAELPRWRWLQHTRISSNDGAAKPPPYVAVMGIPSADTVFHAQLRAAQRSTWFRYSAVARRENDFAGRLLPLYIFTAPEHEATPDPTWVGQDEDVGPAAAAEFYRPTMQEFTDASNFHRALAASASSRGTASGSWSYRQRRMSLRPEWRTSDLTSSPCAHVVSSTVYSGAGNPRPPLAVLADYLRLPVTPALTAVARFLCEASSNLWLEALQHSNALWLDTLTDRRPAMASKEGAGESGGVAKEVGMSQKTVLWLEYAYHAFPTVPFIAKADDCTYIKVPQMVRDFALVLSAQQHPDLVAGVGGDPGRAPAAVEAFKGAGGGGDVLLTDVPRIDTSQLRPPRSPEGECVYWGLLGATPRGGPYFQGMHYVMTRKVARIVLEPPQEAYGTGGLRDVALFAMLDFNPIFADVYADIAMTEEDRLIGRALHDRQVRATQLCPTQRITYVEEGASRFHELHREVGGTVTWASVVMHHCTPADMHYLYHHYFMEEHRASSDVTPAEAEVPGEAVQQPAAQRIRTNVNASRELVWDALKPVPRVSHRAHPEKAKGQIFLMEDGVAVYNITFTVASDNQAMRAGGLMIVPHVTARHDGDAYPAAK
ncbi:hypothetical protein LSCM1_08242 [Leishmania martiniquensis]|uniref:Phosphoglycan beta 1,3 galactosyltransferase n=1 Tax=Leishmania martiniquensis TaxID=1580590 RepID=A0A836KW47_9TRYP|nr:hypothetical protein LSCM1_08242 [Leishmania martiniquensis]